jgi:hypothetical protein
MSSTGGESDAEGGEGANQTVQTEGGEGLDQIIEGIDARIERENEDDGPDDNETLAALRRPLLGLLSRNWIRVPFQYQNRTCSVTQFVHCLTKLDGMRHLPTGATYVLLGKGWTMPDHFRWWVYCMHRVNRLDSLEGCVVPVRGETRLITAAAGKKAVKAIGVARRVRSSRDSAVVNENWIQTAVPHETFVSRCRGGGETYGKVEVVEMWWGLIPVEYALGGEVKRELYQVKGGGGCISLRWIFRR